MQKISIKELIKFRSKSENSKKHFVYKIKIDKVVEPKKGKGGDYWITSLSAISNSFKFNNKQYIKDKIEELETKIDNSELENSKSRFKKNIELLYQCEDFDFKKWTPSKKILFLKKQKSNSILTIKGLKIQVIPHHVFTFKKDDIVEIGSIWFIAQKKGFSKPELGVFVESLYRYLKTNYSKDYAINSKYCIAVDVVNGFDVNYSQLEKKDIPSILIRTIDDINKYM